MFFRVLLLFCFVLPAWSLNSLPDLGHPSEKILTPEAEKQLGKAFIRALKAQTSFINDELVSDYIRNLGFKLVSKSPEQGRDFNFFVIDSNEINAFAGPDATIGINKGLILAANNESQLASVMAHEIAHVTQKHLTRAFQASSDTTAATLAAVLAGILVSSADPTAGAALVFGGVASGMQQSINFTRSNEYEADRVGIQILDESNINPKGMIEFFEILQSSSFYGSENDIEYLRTHPLNSARIAEATSRTPTASFSKPNDSLNFQLARERLIVANHDNPNELMKDYQPVNDEKPSKAYSRALIYLRLDKTEKAIETLTNLIKHHSHLWYELSLAKTYLKADKVEQSLSLYKRLAQIYPEYPPVTHAYSRALIKSKKYAQSIKILEKQLLDDNSSTTYELLAQSYFAQNNLFKAYTVRAEQYANEGLYETAVQQLANAIKLPGISTETIRRLHAKMQIYKNEYKKETEQILNQFSHLITLDISNIKNL